jgi:hypothetical protein
LKHFLLISVLMLAASCGKKNHSAAHKTINQVFVKGNPLTMVADTTKNKTSFINTTNLNDFSSFAMSALYIFAEKELITKEESEDIEAGNEAETADQTTSAAMTFNIKNMGSNEYALENKEGDVSFGFEASGGLLNLTSIKLGTVRYDATIEHYSLSTDKSKYSFLLRLKTQEDGEVLISAGFYRYSEKKPTTKVSTSYHYLYGPGVVVPWKLDATRKVIVDVCPSMTKKLSFMEVEDAIEKWEQPFKYKTQKLDLDVRAATSCKPFSDVDQHAIHYIDSYLTMADKGAYNPGFTMIHSDLSVGNIFDADIILLGSEIKKDRNFNSMDFGRTLSHEFGHFLGLDHQFDGPMSMMSYEQIYIITNYDSNAITELYKN